MLTTIIFSFDRAMQLDLLLESIALFDTEKLLDLHVIYSTTNDDFENGYEKLKKKFSSVSWHKEFIFKERFVWPIFPWYWRNYYWWIKYKHNRYVKSDFKTKIISIISNTESDLIMFLTDDSLFFEKIEFNIDATKQITQNGYDYSYSLRHGKNIFGGIYSDQKELISWEVTNKQYHPEWSYQFSVDGHVYNKKILSGILDKVIFKNPNTLEGNLACYIKEKNLFYKMVANKKSCLLGFELNRVQTISDNNNLNISNSIMNKLYLKGYRLHLNYILTEPHLFRPEIQKVSVTNNDHTIILYEQK